MPKSKPRSKEAASSEKKERVITEHELKRRQELQRVAYRQKQMREQHYAHVNNMKINNQWRKIKRLTKVDELKRCVEVLAQDYEREIDTKDAIVQVLDRDLDYSEDQHLLAVRSHAETVERLSDFHHSAIHRMQGQFQERCQEMRMRFIKEREDIVLAHEQQKREIDGLIALMESEFDEAETNNRQEFEAQREEIKNRNSEEYNVLKIQLESNVEGLERNFEEAHRAYLNRTDHRSREFKKLSRSDALAASTIHNKTRRLQKLQDSLAYWKTKISDTLLTWEERNKTLRAEKEMMSKHYRCLKSSMERFRSGQCKRLKSLSSNSRDAEELICQKLQTAESVLKLWRMSQMFETEKDHISPFCSSSFEFHVSEIYPQSRGMHETRQKGKAVKYDDTTVKNTACSEARAAHTSTAVNAHGRKVDKWNYLQNFFKKFNTVVTSVARIDEEKSVLEKENAKLRTVLKRYLNGLSINPEVLDDVDNSLLIVNNRNQQKVKAMDSNTGQ